MSLLCLLREYAWEICIFWGVALVILGTWAALRLLKFGSGK